MRIRHAGFTLIELLIVVSIIGTLISLLIPAVQTIRESARSLHCKNNLRQLALASQNFDSSFRHLPIGTLGFSELLSIPDDLTYSDYENESHSVFWKNAQHISSLGQLLPYLEQQSLAELIPAQTMGPNSIHQWPGELDTVALAGSTQVAIFHCPSDQLADDTTAFVNVSAQPVSGNPSWLIDRQPDNFIYMRLPPAETNLQRTNYLGCSGAHSGVFENTGVRPSGYHGAMSCRRKIATQDLRDGLSTTILYGESIGTVSGGRRISAQSWLFGGLARGRGAAPWGEIINPTHTTFFLGDWKYANEYAFASKHPSWVNVARCDGSTHSVSRNIDLPAWYGLCGIADGVINAE